MSRFVNAVLTLGVAVLLFAAPAAAVDSFFDIFTDLPSVGIAPLPPHHQAVGHMNVGLYVPDVQHHTTLRQMSAGGPGGTPLPAQAVSLNGLPPGEPWIDSFFDITYRIDLAGGNPWPELSFFDVFYEIEIPGFGPRKLVPRNASLPPTDPGHFFDVFYLDSFFDITYRVEIAPGAGSHELHLHGECQPGSRVKSLQVLHSPVGDSFFDVFVELEVIGSPPDPAQPVLRTVTNGEYLSPPVPAQSSTWGAVKGLYR